MDCADIEPVIPTEQGKHLLPIQRVHIIAAISQAHGQMGIDDCASLSHNVYLATCEILQRRASKTGLSRPPSENTMREVRKRFMFENPCDAKPKPGRPKSIAIDNELAQMMDESRRSEQ